MISVDDWLSTDGIDAKMIMQVHDELVFEVSESEADRLMITLPDIMAGVAALDVPLLVEAGMGDNWDEAH